MPVLDYLSSTPFIFPRTDPAVISSPLPAGAVDYRITWGGVIEDIKSKTGSLSFGKVFENFGKWAKENPLWVLGIAGGIVLLSSKNGGGGGRRR